MVMLAIGLTLGCVRTLANDCNAINAIIPGREGPAKPHPPSAAAAGTQVLV